MQMGFSQRLQRKLVSVVGWLAQYSVAAGGV
jgi:hypothetical protein